VIVGAASGGLTSAIILYEAALGLGIASGPLLGGLLGGISWRGPFFGTAVLMAIGFLLITVMLGPIAKPARRVSLTDPLKALGHGGLRSMAIVAVLYNFGFFTILAYTPFPLGLSTHQLGIVYFGWGLLVAITSVFGAQRLERRFGLVAVLGVALAGVALDLLAGGILIDSVPALIVVVVVSGALLGIVNTVLTEAVMAAAVVERPVASSAYSFVRFTGGAIAPWVAGKLGEHVSAGAPMYLGAGMVALSVVALSLSRHHLGAPASDEVPTGAVLVAIDAEPSGRLVATAERVARARRAAVHVVHVHQPATLDEGASAIVDAAVGRLNRAGVRGATGEVLHNPDPAGAVLALAERTGPSALIVGRRPGLTTTLADRAPCDVVVVAA
jgi:MFS transporter, ACDE family, multidrug resistance protein